jgi:hypothetical protein
MTFQLKEGDTSPAIKFQLLGSDGSGVNITGAEVRFIMADGSTTVVDDDTTGNVKITDAATGKVRYDWQQGDTSDSGIYEAEWEVTYTDGTVETFPNSENIIIRIAPDLA